MKLKEKYNIPLFLAAFALVVFFVILLLLFPTQMNNGISAAFNWCTSAAGTPVQLLNLSLIILSLYIALSKYGNVKLGKGKPKYSTFSWLGMIFTSGLGAATMYWGIVEWTFLYNANPLVTSGGVVSDVARYEWAFAYHWFHWSPFVQLIYTACGVACGYLYYNRKKTTTLSLGETMSYDFKVKKPKVMSSIVDVVFIFSVISSAAITVGLGLPAIGQAAGYVFNFTPGQNFYYILILSIALVYFITSYIGLDKGMKNISNWCCYGVIALGAYVLIVGPTRFILDSYLSGASMTLNNLPRMLLWLDPIGENCFPQWWTVWDWLYSASFGTFTGLFLARISEGRSLRSITIGVATGTPLGLFCYNGIMSNYGIWLDKNGIVDLTGMTANGQSYEAIVEVFKTLPMPKVVALVFCVVGALFLATTLDSSTFTAANIIEKNRPEGVDPSPVHRLCWSILCTVIPLVCLLINVDLNVFKSLGIVVALPILVVEVFLLWYVVKQLREDYGMMTDVEIKKLFADEPVAEAAKKN